MRHRQPAGLHARATAFGLLFILATGISESLFAQSARELPGYPAAQHFDTSLEYDPQNMRIDQDERGLLYVANRGILVFDGTKWKQHKLPFEAYALSLATAADGRVYVGSSNDFGYFAPNEKGAFVYWSLVDRLPEDQRAVGDIWGLAVNDSMAFFNSYEHIIGVSADTVMQWTPSTAYTALTRIRDDIVVWEPERGLLALEGDSLVLRVPAGEVGFENIAVVLPYGAAGYFFIGREHFGTWDDGRSRVFDEISSRYREHVFISGVQIDERKYAIGTVFKGMLIVDVEEGAFQVLEQGRGLPVNGVNDIHTDHEGNIWAAHNNGLSVLRHDVMKIGPDEGVDGIVMDVTFHGGARYACSMSGLYHVEPSGDGVAVTSVFPGHDCWDVVIFNGNLLAGSDDDIYLVDGKQATKAGGSAAGILQMVPSKHEKDVLIVADGGGVRMTRWDGVKLVEEAWLEGLRGNPFEVVESGPRELLVAYSPRGLTYVKLAEDYMSADTAYSVAEEWGLSGDLSAPYRMSDHLTFRTNNGLLRRATEGSGVALPDSSLGVRFAHPTESSPRLIEEADGGYWVTTEDEFGFVSIGPDGTPTWQPHSLGGIRGGNIATVATDTTVAGFTVWVASTRGLLAYVPDDPSVLKPALIRSVGAGDSLLVGGVPSAASTLALPYEGNQLRIEYALPAFRDAESILYQSRLIGATDEWSSWTSETEAQFMNLDPGDYRFEVRARDHFGRVSEPGIFDFAILTPWYATWWAYLAYALLVVGIVAGAVRGWTWRLRERNRRLENIVSERTKALRETNRENERLLLNILPGSIANRLKEGEETIADRFPEVTVLFADLVDFTRLSADAGAERLVELLNGLFSEFDRLAIEHGVEKIKTIGDAYMAVSGLPEPRDDHAESAMRLAQDMLETLERFNAQEGVDLRLRVGLNTGSVVAGVIGRHKFIYDLWGDAVNIAARMESHGVPGRVHVSTTTFQALNDQMSFEPRGKIDVKGKGLMETYLVAAPTDT